MIRFAAIFFVPAWMASAVSYRPSAIIPPKPVREFRGMWIATVANIDWPSKPGLSTVEQKQELIGILDRAAQLKLNAVIFQARPACDAMYASSIEPWSEYLTGTMGRPPMPFYDPLAFAVEESHKRGLELHAWFNPYRALHFSNKSQIAANHVSRTHPELVKKYGKYLWLDPGDPGVRDYTLSVVMDVVKRYDIDGVHFDDYFYPDRMDSGADSDFPDDVSWRRFGASGMSGRDDWRRENVNVFIERAYRLIKAAKPWVKFGVSPHGIWRPGYPPQIKGLDAYTSLYADSRKWLANGWLDYFAPQLYWPIESKEQSFDALLNWWSQQNSKGRHLWPGLNVARAHQWTPDEIPNQIRHTRKQPGVAGYICYNTSSLLHNSTLADALLHELNLELALVPASPWLSRNAPARPKVFVVGPGSGGVRLLGRPAPESSPGCWLVQTRSGEQWNSEIIPGRELVKDFGHSQPEAIAVTRIDRFGAASKPAVFEKKIPVTGTFESPHEDARHK
jgi:uncharacterized lipoprotein YddW (UPF0748 family)